MTPKVFRGCHEVGKMRRPAVQRRKLNQGKPFCLGFYLQKKKNKDGHIYETWYPNSLAWIWFISGWKQVVTTTPLPLAHIYQRLKKCDYWISIDALEAEGLSGVVGFPASLAFGSMWVWEPDYFRCLLNSSYTPIWDGQAVWPTQITAWVVETINSFNGFYFPSSLSFMNWWSSQPSHRGRC